MQNQEKQWHMSRLMKLEIQSTKRLNQRKWAESSADLCQQPQEMLIPAVQNATALVSLSEYCTLSLTIKLNQNKYQVANQPLQYDSSVKYMESNYAKGFQSSEWNAKLSLILNLECDALYIE